MTDPHLIRRQRELLQNMNRLAAARIKAEADAQSSFSLRNQLSEAEFEQARQAATSRSDMDREATQREYETRREQIVARFELENNSTRSEYDEVRANAAGQHKADNEKAQKEQQEVRWEATAVFDAAKVLVDKQFKEQKTRLDSNTHKYKDVESASLKLLSEWNQPLEFDPPTPLQLPADCKDWHKPLEDSIGQAETLIRSLKKLKVPRAFKGKRLRWLFLVFWALSVLSAFVATENARFSLLAKKAFTLTPYNLGVIAGCFVGPVLISLVFRAVLAAIAGRSVRRVAQPLIQTIADCEQWGKWCLEQATATHKGQVDEIQSRCDNDTAEADRQYQRSLDEAKLRFEDAIRQADGKYPTRIRQIAEQRDADMRDANSKYPRLLNDIRHRFDTQVREATEKHQQLMKASKGQHETDWNTLARKWWQGLAGVQSEVVEINQECRHRFPDWKVKTAREWEPAQSVPPALRFGEFQVSMDQIHDGIPADERLKAAVPENFTLPALLPFPTGCSMLFKAGDQGRMEAVEALQSVMLRFLTCIPPGKVRFTIIDPVGLGENFAAFMHLADHDEQLVTNRIWTEPQHIDQRLTDLTEHMENVIQKYLRNEFETIEQYNTFAGEVAEPFRIVVVANFPANFNEATARRLVSIASSGARCGVFTLVSVDTRVPIPHGFNLSDLEHHAVNCVWESGRFVWKDADFGRFPLQLDTPPPGETYTQLLQSVGEKAKEAGRVEVPFEFIAPTPDQYWKGDSRPGINVPLGRAGATKTQNLRLGQGTSQHVLIAGKTGSGKSTLLHVLITNTALMYSPDEVQLYLVDFKKGVEFKIYATYELPHARVVAIESEREFGLSVLQRLDAELKRRGDLFRDHGVQDLGSYRQLNGARPLPRLLLVVDEFQEFFVEDDKISQEATLLLDRLVRQGRAFGVHVQLGSQTLGGAYSLARSTLGQMAVRVALQCSEADAHLILSDDNTAARLLSRPGEAIYNDANGLIEGNNFFQIVWLSEERREAYLRRIQEFARKRNYKLSQPQIVFEGNVPSDMRKNHLLHQLVSSSTWPSSLRAPQAWLGEAVAIKDPTAAVFRPQVGSNLIMIGQQDEAALAIVASTLISLAAQHEIPDDRDGPAGARFVLLDGSPVDMPYAGYFEKLSNVLPHPLQILGPREVASVIANVAEAVERRQKSPGMEGPAIYLFIFDLQRFRDLRKQEDDFSFARRGEDKPASPSKQLTTILREGPSVRVHTIIWCDSVNNLNRTFERQMIREFDMRVLFQMSPGDSSTLIDSPIAGKLGIHRAIFYSEEQGQGEKFRPYGLPSDEWLVWVRDQLLARPATCDDPAKV